MQKAKRKTVTEIWIESLRRKRQQAIREGRYFDGKGRDNIVSFDRFKAEVYEDTMPSECNPD